MPAVRTKDVHVQNKYLTYQQLFFHIDNAQTRLRLFAFLLLSKVKKVSASTAPIQFICLNVKYLMLVLHKFFLIDFYCQDFKLYTLCQQFLHHIHVLLKHVIISCCFGWQHFQFSIPCVIQEKQLRRSLLFTIMLTWCYFRTLLLMKIVKLFSKNYHFGSSVN